MREAARIARCGEDCGQRPRAPPRSPPMPLAPMSHPDRVASTLANVDEIRASRGAGPFALPGAGARDARIDLKLLQWRAAQAAGRSAAARQRLAALALDRRPDLLAGTVRDGTALGLAAALEEVVALAPPPAAPPAPAPDPVRSQTFTGKELRKRRDLLVESGGSRVRFSRKEGLLFVDRADGVHSANCLRFEARTDRGTLDGFVGDEAERPRLFSAQFLQPVRYATGPGFTELRLCGRLGRRANGWDCQLVLTGRGDAAAVQLDLRIDNEQRDQRLRARFLGVPSGLLQHECTDVREVVQNDAGGFVAFTLVRAAGELEIDGVRTPVPAAQCRGVVEHRFWMGSP
jgi:hypothetical protein